MENIDEKIAALEKKIDILEERVEQHQQQNNIKMVSYRNYAVIIFTFLSFLGVGTVKYVIKDVSIEAAKQESSKGVSAILNENYIAKEIENQSQKAIANIISEAETRAKDLVSLGYLFSNYTNIGNTLAYSDSDLPKSLESYQQAFSIWEQFSNNFPNDASFTFLMTYSEIQSLNKKYTNAISTCNLAKRYISRPEQKALNLFYEIMYLKITGVSYTDKYIEFESLLKSIEKDAYLYWSCDLFMNFINSKKNNFNDEEKKFVKDLFEKMKQKIQFSAF